MNAVIVSQKTTEVDRPLFDGIFIQSELDKYHKLNYTDLTILSAFCRWVISGRMKENKQLLGHYFYVDYGYWAEERRLSVRYIQQCFDRLCGNFPGMRLSPYPLMRWRQHGKKGRGSKSYYALNEDSMRNLVCWERFPERRMVMTSAKLIEIKQPINQKHARIIVPEVRSILEDLMSVPCVNGKLFTNRMPEDFSGNYTKTLIAAAKLIWALYDGSFFREVSGEDCDEEMKKRIRAVKGSWEKVHDLLWDNAKNYRFWFRGEYSPNKKDWLRHDLGWWLFDRFSGKSVFLQCGDIPQTLKKIGVKMLEETVDEEVLNIFRPLIREQWDFDAMVARIYRMIKWYDENVERLIEAEPNMRYWFDGGLKEWLRKYVDWICKAFGDIRLTQLGVEEDGGGTWDAYMVSMAKKYNYEIP